MAPAWMKKHWAALAVTVVVIVTTVVIRLEGRRWFCECENLRFVIASAWSSHTSQHLFDPYSLSHVQHGLVFFWALLWLAPKLSWQARLVAATAIEAGWEMLENSQFIVNRYRDATAALGYEGDSAVNVLGDVIACVLGFAVARRLGWRGTLVLFFGIEIGLVLAIRDSLLLNILMLFYPLEAVKQWQRRV